MMIWIVFTAMTLIAIAMVLLPLLRKPTGTAVSGAEYDSSVYRDQLKELDRDIERGTIDENQAKSARNEVSRRLLLAQRDQSLITPVYSASGAIAGVISAFAVIPLVAAIMYVKVGSPAVPDLPQAERLEKAVAEGNMSALVIKVERILAKDPNDLKGWSVLAPTYKKMRRYGDSVKAYERILDLKPPSANLLTEYAEAMIMANRGSGDEHVERALNKALELDNKNSKARFYRAAMWQQQGETSKALAEWRFMLKANQDNPGLVKAVQRQIDKAQGNDPSKLPPVNKEKRKLLQQMSPQDRDAMIRNMVDGLSEKLDEDGSDLTGWLRLIGAQMVLGEKAKAAQALAKARDNFKNKPEELAKIAALAKRLGLSQ